VQVEDGQSPVALAVADDAVPRPVAAERDVALGAVQRSLAFGTTGWDGPDGSVGVADSSAAAGVCRGEAETRASVSLSTFSGWWQAARWPLP
jgi:hypothetical protein